MEVASAGFLHSAPSPQREVGLSSDQESRSQLTSVKAGQRSNSPFDPAELGRAGRHVQRKWQDIGWAWDPVMRRDGGSKGLMFLAPPGKVKPVSLWSSGSLSAQVGMGARGGLPLEVCPGTSFQERGLTSLSRGVGQNLRDCKS